MIYSSIYPRPTHHPHKEKEKPTIKYPQDIQVIVACDRHNYGNLYLSNIQAAQNASLLSSLHITSVLSVAKGHYPTTSQQLRYKKYIPIQDGQNINIHQYLHQGVQFITQKLLFTNVLVHCVAGVGRSACFVVAYLMKEQRMGFEQALSFVKSKRKMVNLNASMVEQLKKYEIDLLNLNPRRNKYSFSVRVNTNHNISQVSPSYFQPDSFDEGSILAQLYTHKDKVMEFDGVSRISQKSDWPGQKQALQVGKGMKTENPEQKGHKRSNSREQSQKKASLANSKKESLSKSKSPFDQFQNFPSRFTFKDLLHKDQQPIQQSNKLFQVFRQ